MLDNDGFGGSPLARGADVVSFEHAAIMESAGMAHQRGRQPGAEHGGRQQRVRRFCTRIFTKRHKPGRWQPLQIDRKTSISRIEPEVRYRDRNRTKFAP